MIGLEHVHVLGHQNRLFPIYLTFHVCSLPDTNQTFESRTNTNIQPLHISFISACALCLPIFFVMDKIFGSWCLLKFFDESQPALSINLSPTSAARELDLWESFTCGGWIILIGRYLLLKQIRWERVASDLGVEFC